MGVKLLNKEFNSIDEACEAVGIEYNEVAEEARRQGINTELALESIIQHRKNSIDGYVAGLSDKGFMQELDTKGVVHATLPKGKDTVTKEVDEYVSEHEAILRGIRANRKILAYIKEVLRVCTAYNESTDIGWLCNELKSEISDVKQDIRVAINMLKSQDKYNAEELRGPITDSYSSMIIRDNIEYWDKKLNEAFKENMRWHEIEYIPNNVDIKSTISRRVDAIIAKLLKKDDDTEFWNIWGARLKSIDIRLKPEKVIKELGDYGITVFKVDDIISAFKMNVRTVMRKEKEKQENGTYNRNSPNFYYEDSYDREFSYDKLVKYIKKYCVIVNGIYWTTLESGMNTLGITEVKQIGNKEYTGVKFIKEQQISKRSLLRKSLLERDDKFSRLKHLLDVGRNSRWALKEVLGDLFNKIEDSYDQSDLCSILCIPSGKVLELVNEMAKERTEAGNTDINYDRLWDRAITIVWQQTQIEKNRQ